MSRYVIRLLSFDNHSDIDKWISSFLCISLIKDVVFPAEIHTALAESVTVNSCEDFDLVVIPKSFWGEYALNIFLHGKNKIEMSLLIGIRDEDVQHNAISLSFSDEHMKEGLISLGKLKTFFEEAVPAFNVHSGTVYDEAASRRLSKEKRSKHFPYKHRSYPLDLHWMNYYGGPMLEFLSRNRFDHLKTCSEKFDLSEGIMVVLQQEPYDDENLDHRQRRAQAESELEFSSLLSGS